ncbi:MAG: DUF1127 domain-containing protein [Gammaproteobacteria bacterium]|nr:DUF1127 domain-containing protein [Gammaproteobacteria bacterium]
MTTYTENCSRSIAGHPAGVLEILTQIFRQWMKNQRIKSQVAQERLQLLEMSDGMLQDIGVSRAQAETEARQIDLPIRRSGC